MNAQKGYQKFKSNTLPALKPKLKTFKDGQSPKTFFITCSDSRVCPNTITDTCFGELFVVRNAGNTVPSPSAAKGDANKATLEYAVQALKVEEIVVCGHTKCGAVGALMSGVNSKELPYLNDYLGALEGLKKQAELKRLEGDDVVRENVRQQVENILAYSFVRKKVEAGELRVEGWMYDIESGEMEVIPVDASFEEAS